MPRAKPKGKVSRYLVEYTFENVRTGERDENSYYLYLARNGLFTHEHLDFKGQTHTWLRRCGQRSIAAYERKLREDFNKFSSIMKLLELRIEKAVTK